MKQKKWLTRVKGTSAQKGKAFPIFSPMSPQTAGRSFKEGLKKLKRKTTNPLMDRKPEIPNPLTDKTLSASAVMDFAKEDEQADEEIKEATIRKLLEYMKTHQDLTPEQAYDEVNDQTIYSVEKAKSATNDIKAGLSKIFKKILPTTESQVEEEEKDDAFIY